MPPPSAAMALRESFGDRKNPDISRKITACVACRKLKIKCHMLGSTPPCTRCRTRDLPCNVNKSLQTLLESDASWKESIEQRIENVEKRLERYPLSPNSEPTQPPQPQADTMRSLGERSDARGLEPREAPSAGLNLSCSLGAFPASSITSRAARDERTAAAYRPDLISSGIISLKMAEHCFAYYQEHLNPCIHYIISREDALAAIRVRSSLLVAAICAVATLCIGSDDHHACYGRLKEEVSRKMFAMHYDFDDVRALCISAFWLSDICSALNGLSVRIATQLDLHRCITKMPHVKEACYDRTRLYFLVYLCDHHCSLVYGRPPMTREFSSLKSPGLFLQSGFSKPTDLKLISQVQYWSISRRVFKLFGADVESTAATQRSAVLIRLSDAYDAWHQDWSGVLELEDGISRRTFDLYTHAGKLYLFSHVFRGPTDVQSFPASTSTASSFARQVVNSAQAIVRCITEADGDVSAWLGMLPCYFGTMIAFACVCCIRTVQQQSMDHAETRDTLHHLHKLSGILRTLSTAGLSAHPLMNIVKGLESAMNGRDQETQQQQTETPNAETLDFNFDAFVNDNLDLTFLSNEDFWTMCPDEVASS